MCRLSQCRSWIIVFFVCGSVADAAQPDESPRELAEAGWVELFDGETLARWQPTGDAQWRVEQGAIVTAGDRRGWLMTKREFADFELHVEFRAPAATNSGIFLRTALEPTDPTKDCYELNIAPRDNPFPTGSLVGRVKAAKPPAVWDDKWHAFDVAAEGGKFSIYCDGNLVLQYDDPSPIRRGHIGLQAKEGEVAFRNVRIREIRGP